MPEASAPAAAPAARPLRLFVALNLPPEVREALHAVAEPLRALVGRSASWSRGENLHLTLRFLGDQPPALAEALPWALRPLAYGAEAVTLVKRADGGFHSLVRPRVLWIGLEPNPALAGLYHAVDTACAALGCGREPRSFHPHLTLGRLRPGARVDGTALREALAALRPDHRIPVPSLDLMASELSAAGSRYTRLAALPIAVGRAADVPVTAEAGRSR